MNRCMRCGRMVPRVHLVQWATEEGHALGGAVVCDACMVDTCEYMTVVGEVEKSLSAPVRAMSMKALHGYVVRRAP